MTRALIALALLAACSKGKPDDCEVVKKTPADAPAELSKRYPNNPSKVLEVIEKCVAPTGDECDRVAKIVAAIPTMTPQLKVPSGDVAKLCRESPPEYRRCLLPSYTLAHADECRQVMDKLAQARLEITPRGPGDTVDDCGFVSIFVSDEGTWLATGRDDKSRCFAPRQSKHLDNDWLEAQLRKAKQHPCGPASAEIAADSDVPYQELITTMDVAIKAGFMDTGLSAPDGLAAPLATATPKGAASECPATLIAMDPKDIKPRPEPPALNPDGSLDLPPAKNRLAGAPVLVIARDKMTLNVGGTSSEVTADSFGKALPKTTDGMMILQADQSTPTSVINQVIVTAKTAGYDNLMFAVKNR